MSPSLFSRRERTSDEPERAAVPDGGGSGGRLLRALAGLGVLVMGYVAARRLRSGSGGAAANSLPESASDAGPVGVRPGEGRQSFSGGEAVSVDVEGVGESAEADDELPGEDRTPAEMAELAEADAREEPAEPGEMEVDEELVADVVDDEDEREWNEAEESGADHAEESETDESEAEGTGENGADENDGGESDADES